MPVSAEDKQRFVEEIAREHGQRLHRFLVARLRQAEPGSTPSSFERWRRIESMCGSRFSSLVILLKRFSIGSLSVLRC
jgi:hypothetical protein